MGMSITYQSDREVGGCVKIIENKPIAPKKFWLIRLWKAFILYANKPTEYTGPR